MKGADPKVAEAKTLTDVILRAKAVETAGDKASVSQVSESAQTLKTVREAVDGALEPAGKDARVRKRKQAAPDRINDACQDLEQCVADLVMARASRSLDEEAFDEAVLNLRGSLGKLALESARSIPAPGDGVAWLLAALRQGER